MIDNIKILGHDYKIELTKNLSINTEHIGECCCNDLKIRIDSNFAEERYFGILIHEIIEALQYHLDLGLEHRQIIQLEAGLNQVFKDNPKIKDMI